MRSVPAAVPDHSSQSNHDQICVTSAAYDLSVDFQAEVIRGTATLSACVVAESPVDTLSLDTSGLVVRGVTHEAATLQHTLHEAHPVLGSQLDIPLPSSLDTGASVTVVIDFETSPGASALQFLPPAATAGGVHPYLFTQCQAIHARSLLPCQDSPAVKSAYTASVRVPAQLTALMSAVPTGSEEAGQTGTRTFTFEQKVPIPSYLIALAVGDLEARDIGPVSRVWSEPSVVDAAAYEFADTDAYLQAGVRLCGDYVWGRYDLLLLPPSFPYGGMENPCLTFVTPTLLAGDRSLTNVVAHEIAHSWSGNLVTAASWEHFWLNEGWTVFIERKILGAMKGEAAAQFAHSQGYASLLSSIKQYGADHNYTKLQPDLSGGCDPDDAFSRVPYEKGFALIYHLQQVVGGADAFEPFIKAYFKRFSHQAITSEAFKAFYLEHFKDVPAAAEVDWHTWLHAPGIPPDTYEFDISLGEAPLQLAQDWHTSDVMGLGEGDGPSDPRVEAVRGWGTEQVVAFLDGLEELRSLTPLAPATARRMQALYGFDGSTNSEIQCAWYKLCVRAGDDAVLPYVAAFVGKQGRMKYVRPMYRALFEGQYREFALETFEMCKDQYHPIAKKMLSADMQL